MGSLDCTPVTWLKSDLFVYIQSPMKENKWSASFLANISKNKGRVVPKYHLYLTFKNYNEPDPVVFDSQHDMPEVSSK